MHFQASQWHLSETAQDVSKASIFGRRAPEDGRLDWKTSLPPAAHLVRAVTDPWPGRVQLCGRKQIYRLEIPRA